MTFHRGRRLRRTATLRGLVRETAVSRHDLIQPYFVVDIDDSNFVKPIGAMPGQNQLGLNKLVERVGRAVDLGLAACILFGIPKTKDATGSQGWAENGIVQRAVSALKRSYPDLCVITDVCLCEYTDHGHCGLISGEEVLNDPTLDLLAKVALSHARAGADIVAPSDMMDGRVGAIRDALDGQGFTHLPIMSYAVKYASGFYGPFREAAESPPQFGDRKTYQMDPANRREAFREAQADLDEGADMLMVKPALPYLDILRDLRETTDVPLAAYQVSGEYAMIKAAALNGWIDEKTVVLETLTGIKRAGADLILTYFTENVLEWLE
ncbi:porphobilinogen synthase [Desulfonatronum thiosulfatophilum]|uniref:Delta-aminolevulinic acid dehydratase n=1 Tax=Desulfonatronum thiosulfatophilum TaxID=617002 RepID=A0A1G6CHE4_9BACT|nr:porphobilinogen synthase [Desulfonatronum thiosulfatophilum]SDB32276.1 porphobilinogen synthase [Desulfonatronum thiosulfatophilum]